MGERLTWEEIERKYPEEWVLLVDLEQDEETLDVRAARVQFHSREQDLVERRLLEERPRRAAVLFIGNPLRPDIAYAL
ncbi:MAG TPA: hypothetical protein VFY90_12145 [Tepidiformaceae bacterium]|nr:hypothetical protein [Tepidiformaceae bacterium]